MGTNITGTITLSNDYIITTPPLTEEPSESVGSTMFYRMKIHKDKIAQIDAKTGLKDTFGELLQRSVRTALYMRNQKITRDHIVTLCTKNHLNSVVPLIATQFLGAITASIDPSFSPQETTQLLSTVRPKIVFASPESVPTLEKALHDISLNSDIVVFGQTEKHTGFSAFLKPRKDEEQFEPVKIENLKETAVIYFSSGTTGVPKAICLNHYSCVGQLMNLTQTDNPDSEYMKSLAEKVSPPLTYLGYASMSWLTSGSLLMGAIMEGYCRLICKNFDGKEIWDLIEKYKPLSLLLTASQVIEMLANRRTDVDVSCVLNISVTGNAISKKYLLKFQEAFPEADLVRGYGQTEACGTLTMFKPADAAQRQIINRPEKIESAGFPVRGISYRVVDLANNKNLGPNQQGELRVKSNFIMNGYYNVDSSDAFDEHGWFKTGDIVYYDEDFCFYVVDRIKETIKYQEVFITPTVLENELVNHPAVQEAVVICIPTEAGDQLMGLVVLNKSFHVSEKEIEKFVEDRVPEKLRLCAGVKFIHSLPMTVTGKVKRGELRRIVLEGEL